MSKRQVDHAALAARWEREAHASLYADDAAPLATRPPANYVAPPAARQAITVSEPAWLAQPTTVIAEGAWTPVVTQSEHSDPMTRAKATGLRMLAWGLVWGAGGLILMAILAMIGADLPWAAAAGALLWVAATAVTSYRIARLDHDVSAGGVERHRIERGYDLARAQLQHDYALRRLALDAYLRSLERHDRAQLEDRRR